MRKRIPQLLHRTADNFINRVLLAKATFEHNDSDRLLTKTSAVVRAPLCRAYLMRTEDDHSQPSVWELP